jgi:hypothetical protein
MTAFALPFLPTGSAWTDGWKASLGAHCPLSRNNHPLQYSDPSAPRRHLVAPPSVRGGGAALCRVGPDRSRPSSLPVGFFRHRNGFGRGGWTGDCGAAAGGGCGQGGFAGSSVKAAAVPEARWGWRTDDAAGSSKPGAFSVRVSEVCLRAVVCCGARHSNCGRAI